MIPASTLAGIDVVVSVAMPDEAAPFLERADAVGERATVGGAEHHVLTVAGRDVLLVRSGIGLATCRRIIQAHGGQIGLDEAPGGGTCAWFEIPA